MRYSKSQHQSKPGKKRVQMDTGAPPGARTAFGTWCVEVPGLTLHLPCLGTLHSRQAALWLILQPGAQPGLPPRALETPALPAQAEALKQSGVGNGGESTRGEKRECRRGRTLLTVQATGSPPPLPERSICFQWMNCSPCTCGYQLRYILNLTCIIYLYIQQRNTSFSSLRVGAAAQEREAGLAGEALQPG